MLKIRSAESTQQTAVYHAVHTHTHTHTHTYTKREKERERERERETCSVSGRMCWSDLQSHQQLLLTLLICNKLLVFMFIILVL